MPVLTARQGPGLCSNLHVIEGLFMSPSFLATGRRKVSERASRMCDHATASECCLMLKSSISRSLDLEVGHKGFHGEAILAQLT